MIMCGICVQYREEIHEEETTPPLKKRKVFSTDCISDKICRACEKEQHEIDNIEAGVWGSQVYEEPCFSFKLLQYSECKLREQNKDNVQAEDVFKKLGIRVKFDQSRSKQDAIEAFRVSYTAWYSSHGRKKPELEEKLDTIDDCFWLCRESSWCLWTAATIIGESVFPGLLIEGEPLPLYPCQNPLEFKLKIGVVCYLLCSYGYVSFEKHADVFGYFDT